MSIDSKGCRFLPIDVNVSQETKMTLVVFANEKCKDNEKKYRKVAWFDN